MQYKAHLSTNNKSPGKNTRAYIVLHHTASKEGSIKGVLNTLTVSRPPNQVSCHYCVDINGDVYKIGEDSDILWHAGQSEWDGKKSLNSYSIGIEILGPLSNGGFTDDQRRAVRELCLELMNKYKIPQKNVIRHKDISPGRKVDVDDNFWNGQFATFKDYQKSLVLETEQDKIVREFADKHGIRGRSKTEPYTQFETLLILSKIGQK